MKIFVKTMSTSDNDDEPHVLELGGRYSERIDNAIKKLDAQEEEIKELGKRVHETEKQLDKSDYRRRFFVISLTIVIPLILMIMEAFQFIDFWH